MGLFRRSKPDSARDDLRTVAEIAFIPHAGACIVSTNVLSGAGLVRWMVREEPSTTADNGWRIFSHLDTEDYLHDADDLLVVDFNRVCEIQPGLIGIWDLPVGSDLQIVDEGHGIAIVDTTTGRPVPLDRLYVPPAHRAAD